MKIIIKGTGNVEDLTILDDNGIEWTYDLLGNAGVNSNEEGQFELSKKDFDWWEKWITNYEEDQKEIRGVAEELDIDIDIIKCKIDEYFDEINNLHEITQNILKEIKKEYK